MSTFGSNMTQFCCSVEFGSLTTSQLMEKVRGLQNLAFQLGLDEGKFVFIGHFKISIVFSHTQEPAFWPHCLIIS